MDSFLRTSSGRLTLILGGIDLALMGAASLFESAELTSLLVAWIPVLSIAVGINIVVLSAIEIGDLFPVSLFSLGLFLGGVYVYGLDSATHAGPAAGLVLLSIGALTAVAGIRSARAPASPARDAASSPALVEQRHAF